MTSAAPGAAQQRRQEEAESDEEERLQGQAGEHMQVVIPVRLQFVCNDGRPPDAVAACRALRQSRTPVLQGPQSTSRGGRRSKKKRTGAAHGRQHLAAVAAVAAEAAAAEGARLISEEEGQAEAEADALSRSRSSRIVGARRLWMRTGRGRTKKGGGRECPLTVVPSYFMCPY